MLCIDCRPSDDPISCAWSELEADIRDKCILCRTLLYGVQKEICPQQGDRLDISFEGPSVWAKANPPATGHCYITPLVPSEVTLSPQSQAVLRECAQLGAEDDNTGSEASLKLARHWLDECRNAHPECAGPSTSTEEWPSRLIDVGPPDGSRDPFLWETGASLASHSAYLALSHCWGPNPILTTTKDTVEQRKISIPFSTIPKTFQDAITITRKFKIRYIWIDSLCIIQDSTEDWEKEAARMSAVYMNALMTISAAKSTSGASGCFSERNGMLSRPFETESGWRSIAIMITLPPPHHPRDHLYSRAWVLQEQVLARRTLIYGPEYIRWNCCEGKASEREPDLQAHPSRFGWWASVEAHHVQLRHLMNKSISVPFDADNWHRVVSSYTKRRLTHQSDKLAAIAGVAHALHRATLDPYLAGNWRKWLWHGLLWRYVSDGPALKQNACHTPPIAPSWSWASATGRLEFTHGMDEPSLSRVSILDASTTTATPSPARAAGRLLLRAPLSTTRTTDQPGRLRGETACTEANNASIALADRGTLHPDEPLKPDTPLWCLTLARDPDRSQCGHGAQRRYALALVPMTARGVVYRRVGLVLYADDEEEEEEEEEEKGSIATVTVI